MALFSWISIVMVAIASTKSVSVPASNVVVVEPSYPASVVIEPLVTDAVTLLTENSPAAKGRVSVT